VVNESTWTAPDQVSPLNDAKPGQERSRASFRIVPYPQCPQANLRKKVKVWAKKSGVSAEGSLNGLRAENVKRGGWVGVFNPLTSPNVNPLTSLVQHIPGNGDGLKYATPIFLSAAGSANVQQAALNSPNIFFFATSQLPPMRATTVFQSLQSSVFPNESYFITSPASHSSSFALSTPLSLFP